MSRAINLEEGYDLNVLSQTGTFAVVNPLNGPSSGNFIIWAVESVINGQSRTMQVAYSEAASAPSVRAYIGTGWTSWSGVQLTGGSAVPVDSTVYNAVAAPTHAEGTIWYDSTAKALSYYNEEADVTLNIGQEALVRVYNDTGVTITNGQAVYITGYDATNNIPTIGLADATQDVTSRIAGIVTHDIEDATIGYVTTFGRVNDIDTSGLTAGDKLWLDPTTPGGFTTTRPSTPDYAVLIGVANKIDVSTGSVIVGVAVDNGGIERLASAVYNGTVIEDPSLSVSSNGTVITFSLEKSGGGDLTLVFDAVPYTLDCTPAATIALTAGTDASPTLNYVYVPVSTKVLTVSTAGWPSEQHVPLATVLCQSAASMQTQLPYKVHKWNDHLSGSDGQGHIAHLNKWIRSQDATWLSGGAVTLTPSASTLDVAVASAVVLQLHDHAFPAYNTGAGDLIYVVNDPDSAYTPVASLSIEDGVDKDASGSTLGTGASDFYNLVIWGVVSEDAADCKVMCNLPSGAYANNNGSVAEDDAENTAVYTIPSAFKGTGFLLARITVNSTGGTYTVVKTTDLRGQKPGLLTGGGALGGNEFVDNVFRIYDNGDSTKQIAFEASGITTATTRTLTVPDASGTIMLTSAIGSTVQAWDADLDAIAALAKTDGNIIVGDGTTWVAESGATARTSFGLGTGDSVTFNDLNVVNSAEDFQAQIGIEMKNQRATYGAFDNIGLGFYTRNSAGTSVEMARFVGQSEVITAGSETGRLIFGVRNAGTFSNYVQVTTQVMRPNVNDGTALGQSGTAWSDLFLASGAVINFNAGNVTLTHSADTLTSNANITITKAATPTLELVETGLPSNPFLFENTGTIGKMSMVTASGTAILDTAAKPSDGTSDSQFRYFRETNTTGAVVVDFLRGDGTATIVNRIRSDGGDSYFTNSLAIGTSTAQGKLLVFSGESSSGSTSPSANGLVIENSGHGGLTILTPSINKGSIFFGDPGSTSAGRIRYDHNSGSMEVMIETVAVGLWTSTQLAVAGTIKSGSYTIATLPAAGTAGAGARAYVSDGVTTAPAVGATVSTTGTVGRAVYSDGTSWRYGG